MTLSDNQIARLCNPQHKPMISPFIGKKSSKEGGPSFGLSSYGYDIRLGDDFIIITADLVDPKHPDEIEHEHLHSSIPFILAPGAFILGSSIERFIMPSTVTGFVKDKSTYARCGIAVQNTVIEAGWEGILTLEISNHSESKVLLYPGEGIAQIMFDEGLPPSNVYNGKYQNQTGVTLPR